MKHYQCELDGQRTVVTVAGDEADALRAAREQLNIPAGQDVKFQSARLVPVMQSPRIAGPAE